MNCVNKLLIPLLTIFFFLSFTSPIHAQTNFKPWLVNYSTNTPSLENVFDGIINLLDLVSEYPPITTPTIPPPGSNSGIWISPERLASLPASGTAWSHLTSAASQSCPSPNLSNQENQSDVCVLAKALVYAKTGNNTYRSQVKNYIQAAMGTEGSGGGQYNVAALGRNGIAFIISADLIDLKNYDPSFDSSFRNWLSQARYKNMDGWVLASGGESGTNCTETRPNNVGMHCAATATAAAAYLNDTSALQRSAQIFKGWLGDRSSYSGFSYGDLSWQCNESAPVGINPQGCTKQGYPIGGVLPDDERRAGGFTWPPPCENYVREALQGALAQAIILHQAGYDVWNWENQALRRAAIWWTQTANCSFTSDDEWEPWVFNYYYGINLSAPSNPSPGKNVGWTDWTHQK